MKANIFQKIGIIARSIYVTLKITVIVLVWQLRGSYDRKKGDSLLMWWSSKLLDAVKATYEVSNPYGVILEPGKRYIIMSNHRSHYDIPLIFLAFPLGSIRMLTKKELFKVPLWGKGMKAGEFISIDRHDHEQALKDLKEAKAKMEDGIVLWVAPEGTRSRDGRLGPFKKGGIVLAIETAATVIPVGIVGSEKVLPAGTTDFNLGQHVVVNIGRPIEASKYTMDQRDALMRDVRSAIEGLISYHNATTVSLDMNNNG